MNKFLVDFVDIATQISSPLMLASLAILVFTLIARQALTILPAGVLDRYQTYNLFNKILTYGFTLSLVALVLGILSWLVSTYIGPSVALPRIQAAFNRNDQQSVQKIASAHLTRFPKDDEVRHKLGTSYFSDGKFGAGVMLYKDMLDLYKTRRECSDQIWAANASLAAFYVEKEDASGGLPYSTRAMKCADRGDGTLFNHMKLLAIAKDDNVLTLPRNRQFSRSYFRSRYKLLTFVHKLSRSGKFEQSFFPDLANAYCLNDRFKSIIQGRFINGDLQGSPGTADSYAFEVRIVTQNMPVTERRNVMKQLRGFDCVI